MTVVLTNTAVPQRAIEPSNVPARSVLMFEPQAIRALVIESIRIYAEATKEEILTNKGTFRDLTDVKEAFEKVPTQALESIRDLLHSLTVTMDHAMSKVRVNPYVWRLDYDPEGCLKDLAVRMHIDDESLR